MTLGHRMRTRCGYSACDAANQHLEEARQGAPLCFVYDFVFVTTPFTDLRCLFDAQRLPLVEHGEAFEAKYPAFPRKLFFQAARTRTTTHNDWLSNIYV